jgi:hypothetical protein
MMIWSYCLQGRHFNDLHDNFSGFYGMHASKVLGLLLLKTCVFVESSGWHEEAVLAI